MFLLQPAQFLTNCFCRTAEEVLILMTIAPIIFYGLIDETYYLHIVEVCKTYLALIYRVTAKNVSEWSCQARSVARRFHQTMNWSATLNWHLVKSLFLQKSLRPSLTSPPFIPLDLSLGSFYSSTRSSSDLLGLGDGTDESLYEGSHLHHQLQEL